MLPQMVIVGRNETLFCRRLVNEIHWRYVNSEFRWEIMNRRSCHQQSLRQRTSMGKYRSFGVFNCHSILSELFTSDASHSVGKLRRKSIESVIESKKIKNREAPKVAESPAGKVTNCYEIRCQIACDGNFSLSFDSLDRWKVVKETSRL